MAFKSWWQWPQIKLRTVSMPLVELTWHRPLSFPTVTLIWILSGEGQNRSSINHFKSLVRVEGTHTAFTMKRRLQFYIHSLLTNLLGTRTYMWLSFMRICWRLTHHIMRKPSPKFYAKEMELCRLHSKLKEVKTILEDIMLKETNSNYFNKILNS